MVKLFIPVLVLALLFAVGVRAQDDNAAKDTKSATTMKGYVLDAMCGKDMASKDGAMAKAAKHPVTCALKDECSSSGYGLMSDGKYYKFDEKGDEQAKALLRKTKKKNGVMVEVTGTQDGDNLAVNSMKEVKAPKAGKKMGKKTQG